MYTPALIAGTLSSDLRWTNFSCNFGFFVWFLVEGALYHERDTTFQEPNALNTLYSVA